MNRRVMTILLSAFLIAAICSFLVYRLVLNHVAAAHQPATRVIAASADIKLGTVLSADDLTTVQIDGPVPRGAILKAQDAIGRGAITNLYQGELIMDSRLAAPGSGGGLASTIPPGMRACAVKVDEVVGVAGFATPGMRVDVLVSGNPPGTSNTTEGPKVSTLLQNIEVLSAGTDIQKDAAGKPQQVQVVNLLVNPEQAQVLSLASSQTHIQLVLRNPLDTQVAEIPGSAVANLFSNTPAPQSKPQRPAAPATVHKAPSVFLVEVLNGSKRSEEKFASQEGQK
jgi:pilus assembly protein CpaB